MSTYNTWLNINVLKSYVRLYHLENNDRETAYVHFIYILFSEYFRSMVALIYKEEMSKEIWLVNAHNQTIFGK